MGFSLRLNPLYESDCRRSPLKMSVGFQNLFINSVLATSAIYSNLLRSADRNKAFPSQPVDYNLPQLNEYDFIIAGAGAAGAPLANKLSKKFSVLLLESGGNPPPILDVPAAGDVVVCNGYPFELHGWNSTQQEFCNLDEDGIVKLTQGNCLGGGTCINGMSYNRGNPKDFDNWAKLTRDESWTYKNVLKFFKMSENFVNEQNANDELGVGGPINIIRRKKFTFKEYYAAFVKAGRELGYRPTGNSNGPQTPGFGAASYNMLFGRRVSTYKGFLEPILNRKNLKVSRYSVVSHVDVDKSLRAVGVYYTRYGVELYAKARLEVILSAGAMNSPLILLRSGIGPAAKLKSLGITVKRDLPVGEGLQDHPVSSVCAPYQNNSYGLPIVDPKDIHIFSRRGTGSLTNSWREFGQAFIVSSTAKRSGEGDWPDIQLFPTESSAQNAWLSTSRGICIAVYLTRPRSRGSIFLDPRNVMNPGIWDARWLTDKRDIRVFAEGMSVASKVLKSNAFESFGAPLPKTPHPSCTKEPFDSIKYWECYVQRITLSCLHPTGTCKMGAIHDETAVVDTKFNVKGVQGLRVIDNSIQPEIVNSNLMASAIMIGQKGAQEILKKYKGLA